MQRSKLFRRLGAAVLVLSMMSGCTKSDADLTITNTVDFAYEEADMSGYIWLEGDTADFRKITMKEALRMFTEDGSGILYFGYAGCPWCERAVPILNEAALQTNTTIWYIDTKASVEQDDFTQMKDYLYDALPVDTDGNKNFYVPFVVGVKKGEVTGHHTSLVDSFEIVNSDDQMSDSQKTELKNYYLDIIRRTAD